MIHAVFNKAEKSAEFVTRSKKEPLKDIRDPSQFTWLRPFKDKRGSYPSKWICPGLNWEDLQELKNLSKATSGNDHVIRIWSGKSHLDLAWSAEYIYEDCSYWVHVSGPLHWRSIDTLEKILSRYIRGRVLTANEDICNPRLLAYMDAYLQTPCIWEVEGALRDVNPRLELLSIFTESDIYSVRFLTPSGTLLQVNVTSGIIKLTAHKLGDPWGMDEIITEINYEDNWRECLKSAFFEVLSKYSQSA